MNKDYEILKKKYGEHFAKLCRSLFPSLIEKEGQLSSLIIEKFAESKFLYEDIVNNSLQNGFKNYIMSFVKRDKGVSSANSYIESPFTLMKKAGYTLYKCETDNDVKSFRKYWEAGEELCTFWDNKRINSHLIFFAVKDNVNEIKRENFKSPLRQDEYGTSVISIQFTKSTPITVSIKNRYNHTVVNPDATFSNDLENIYAGLTKSFVEEYYLNLVNDEIHSFEIPGYVLAQDGRMYKYNYEIGNIYYCPNNIIIEENRQVTYLDKDKELLFDYFVLNFENKKLTRAGKGIEDGFVYGIKDINKIEIKKYNNEKTIIITPKIGENILITLDNTNRIIKYINSNITEIDDNFLQYNEKLSELDLFSLKRVRNWFLKYNKELTKLNLPKLENAGDYFLNFNKKLNELNLPNIIITGNEFLYDNQELTILNLPKLENAGDYFLNNNEKITELNLQNLKKAGSSFLYYNEALTVLNVPKLKEIEEGFLNSHPKRSSFIKNFTLKPETVVYL